MGVRERFYQFIQPYDLHAIRSAAITGGAVYMLFTIIDYLINDIIFTQTMIIRIAVVGPCSILALALTFYSPFKDNNKALQFLSVLIVTIGQAGHFAIGLMREVQPFYLLITSILLMVFANTLMCLRFSIATILNVIYFIIFQIIHAIQGTDYIELFYQNVTFLCVIAVSLHACYLRERDKHLLFLHYDEANGKKRELIKVNAHLEDLLNNLDNKNKELEQFAYVVSHDLKSPLRVISGLSSLIQRKEYEKISPTSQEDFDMIKDQIMQMNAMIEGVLEYSRIGREATGVNRVDVSAIMEKIKLVEERNGDVIVTYPDDMLYVKGSRIRVQQVFQNLISNSIKYNDKKVCEISIGAEITDNFILFTVEDNGPGIAPEYTERVFRLFQTLQSKREDSTGVGLAVVKKIIEYYRGEIYIDTTYKKGARFCFSLPYFSEESLLPITSDNEMIYT